jgi:DNA/RNA-binding domain of Phe-tRNA-synthetase-like protein
MQFQHSGDIWRDFPALVPAVLYAEGITAAGVTAAGVTAAGVTAAGVTAAGVTAAGVTAAAPGASSRADGYAAVAKERLAASPESELPEIQAWRRAFGKMGLKPTQYRCASEALLRRFRKEGSLPPLHPLVDLCNAVSLAFAIPVAVLDVSMITGGIEVRYATGAEEYLTFAGELEHPAPGEVIFADEAGRAHARRWTNRQSGLSAVKDSTTAALIVAEALHDEAALDMTRLTAAVAADIEALWSVTPSAAILTASSPRFTFAP